VQDAWKASSKLTLNYGIRWEPYFPLTNDDDHVLIFDPARFAANQRSTVYVNAPAGLIFPGDAGYPGHAASKGQHGRSRSQDWRGLRSTRRRA
jgi:hypothetical protein